MASYGSVDASRLEEDHRVGIPDGRGQQSLGLIRVGRHHYLQTRNMGKDRLHALRVVFEGTDAASVGSTHHQGHGELAATAVAHTGGVADQLVIRRVSEPGELDLRHWSEPGDGHPDSHAYDPGFGQRRVDHSLRTEPLEEALGHPEDPPIPAHVFAQHDHALIALHFLQEALVDGLHHVEASHLTASFATWRAGRPPALRGVASSARTRV